MIEDNDDEHLYTEAEFKAAFPDRAFTWDLDEHPDDDMGKLICACRPCRELGLED